MLRKLLFQSQPPSIFAHAAWLGGNKQQMRAGEMEDDGIYHFERENGRKEKRSTFFPPTFPLSNNVLRFELSYLAAAVIPIIGERS